MQRTYDSVITKAALVPTPELPDRQAIGEAAAASHQQLQSVALWALEPRARRALVWARALNQLALVAIVLAAVLLLQWAALRVWRHLVLPRWPHVYLWGILVPFR